MLAPCLHRFPVAKQDPVHKISRESELDRQELMFTYPSFRRILLMRHKVIRALRDFFEARGFVEVQTPILAGSAGGASARPFSTTATEFPERELSLRIAPELWLKRLIIGGMSKIYEIGPSFRNEGLDKTHNPEFTTCEFYTAYATLKDLMEFTEQMIQYIEQQVALTDAPDTTESTPLLTPTPKVIDFIPALNQRLGLDLPTLDIEHQDEVLDIMSSKGVPIPENTTLPNLLDRLSSHYLEHSASPSWIINLPSCISPLSKSFTHPSAPNNQPVAARAELYLQRKEIVNCYEEENDPAAQQQKFVDQQIYAANPAGASVDKSKTTSDQADVMKIDHDYIKALEWGMPPTGGWGCGIDRLVMLFAGTKRIRDVLSFGDLRAVSKNASVRPDEER
jgi:lysyl-tRNA synthetase, class II